MMVDLPQWRLWQKEHFTVLPFVKGYPLSDERIPTLEPFWAYSRSGYGVVLESGKDGRYTFLGIDPESILEGKGESARVLSPDRELVAEMNGKPLPVLREWMKEYRSPVIPGAPKCLGGLVGFFGYDVVRSLEKLPVLAKDDLPLPDYLMLRFHKLWIVDQQERLLYCAVYQPVFEKSGIGEAGDALAQLFQSAKQQAEDMKRIWDDLARPKDMQARRSLFEKQTDEDKMQVDVAAISGAKPDFERAAYMDAVKRIQEYIMQGDVFQVNLSVRQSRSLACPPEQVYEWLRLINPSPYMGMIRTPDFHLVSGSPELLVQLEGQKVRTRPIAGTRPRGATLEEDKRFAEELLASEKERAEHIMLVDLERNDLGKISRYGSVRVDELMVIESYSHVMHIVSEVTGELQPERDAFDTIEAAFPGGTITGAPKIRTMEIIEELEPVRRGPYTGSIGWIDYNGNMELNIVIRTLVVQNGIGYVQAGAGIVIDSDPEREYIESINKAKAMWKAIQYAERFG